MGLPKLPTKAELATSVDDLFRGSGWEATEVWMEWWNAAWFVRLMIRPTNEIEDGAGGALERAYSVRKWMLERTGTPWVVVVYPQKLTNADRRRIVKRMAKRFG